MENQLLLPAYVVVFMLAVGTFVWWGRRLRRRRPPFKRETKVLRLPGESLRRKVAELDDRLLDQFFVAWLVPLVLAAVLLQLLRFTNGWWGLALFVFIAVVFAVAVAKSAKWMAKKFFVRGNYELGW